MDKDTVAVRAFFEELEKAGAAPSGMKIMYVGKEFGAGHLSQAKNLEAAAKKRGIEAETIDFHRTFGKPGSRAPYEKAVSRHLGELSLASGAKLSMEHVRHYTSGVDRKKLKKYMDRNKDKAVVLTMPHLQYGTQSVKNPIHILHTDPKAWVGETAMSPMQRGKRIHVGTRAAMRGLIGADEKKSLRGLPVHPDVLHKGKPSGLVNKKDFNVTVSGGALGLDVLPMTEQVLQGLPDNAVVHALAGRSTDTKKRLESLAKKDSRVRPHGFAPLGQMMRESDLNVLRAHGTSFQESVAAGKPAVYFAPSSKAVDYQGRLTKNTAEYGRKNMKQPSAIGLGKLRGAVAGAVGNMDKLRQSAGKNQKAMGNPADDAVRFIMKPRSEYIKTAGEPPKKKSKVYGFLRKAGPGIGGAIGAGVGALAGARRGRMGALKGAIAGLGTGATIGWVPDMAHGVREGVKGLK